VPYNFPSIRPPIPPLITAYLPASDCLAPPTIFVPPTVLLSTLFVGAGLAPPAANTVAMSPRRTDSLSATNVPP